MKYFLISKDGYSLGLIGMTLVRQTSPIVVKVFQMQNRATLGESAIDLATIRISESLKNKDRPKA